VQKDMHGGMVMQQGIPKMRTLHWHYCFLQREAPHAFGYATLFVDPVACADDGLCRSPRPPGAMPSPICYELVTPAELFPRILIEI
jgi:hypothetical protein